MVSKLEGISDIILHTTSTKHLMAYSYVDHVQSLLI